MSYYRLYLCDRYARFEDVVEGMFGTDAAAIEAARALRRAGTVQVFQAARHVITVVTG